MTTKPDFLSPALNYRRRKATVRNEALARAAGLRQNVRPVILDATAGFGQDSFILASLGCEVYLFERCPAVYDLLKEALAQIASDPTLAPVAARMHLTLADAGEHLSHPPVPPDVIYLDPMFPAKTKSAAPAKAIQLLQSLAGSDADSADLLRKALSCAPRIVVKRPRLSSFLADLTPHFSIKGTSSRFDVYLRKY